MACDYLNGWIKNGQIRKNLTQNGELKSYSWGTQKKKKKKFVTNVECGLEFWTELEFFICMSDILVCKSVVCRIHSQGSKYGHLLQLLLCSVEFGNNWSADSQKA